MRDTTLRAEQEYRRLLLAQPGEKRLLMGCSLFDSARKLAIAGLTARSPALSPRELKQQLFLRTYGRELTPVQIARVLARLS